MVLTARCPGQGRRSPPSGPRGQLPDASQQWTTVQEHGSATAEFAHHGDARVPGVAAPLVLKRQRICERGRQAVARGIVEGRSAWASRIISRHSPTAASSRSGCAVPRRFPRCGGSPRAARSNEAAVAATGRSDVPPQDHRPCRAAYQAEQRLAVRRRECPSREREVVGMNTTGGDREIAEPGSSDVGSLGETPRPVPTPGAGSGNQEPAGLGRARVGRRAVGCRRSWRQSSARGLGSACTRRLTVTTPTRPRSRSRPSLPRRPGGVRAR